MDFRTIINIPKSDFSITHHSTILSIGSCFAENIGNRLQKLRFNIDVNPFGIQYNPASIAQGLKILISKKQFCAEDLFFYNDLWSSPMHHSDFSDVNQNICLQNINNRINSAAELIRHCDIYLFTFGTAWIYEDKSSNEIVSNCHKLPANKFNRRRLSITEIVEIYKSLINNLLQLSPTAKFIFSVSPIRHWKDGAHENQISKSTLLLAIEQLCEYSNAVRYFPSYEIMMDELRDYRFYDSDMLHPNSVAIDYIWQQLSENYFDKQTIDLNRQIESIIMAANHRPFNPNTEAHKRFLKTNLEKTQQLLKQHPYLQLQAELKYFSQNNC